MSMAPIHVGRFCYSTPLPEPAFVAVVGQPEVMDHRPEINAFPQNHMLEMVDHSASLLAVGNHKLKNHLVLGVKPRKRKEKGTCMMFPQVDCQGKMIFSILLFQNIF